MSREASIGPLKIWHNPNKTASLYAPVDPFSREASDGGYNAQTAVTVDESRMPGPLTITHAASTTIS